MRMTVATLHARLPASLFARNLLLLCALILFAALCMGLLLRLQVQQPRLQQYQDFVVQQARSSARLLTALAPAQRAAWQAAQSRPEPHLPQQTQAPQAANLRAAHSFSAALRQQLPPNQSLHWQVQGEQARLWLGTRVDGQTWWQELDTSTLQTNLPGMIISLLLASLLLAAGGAYWLARRLHTPLQQLAAAARDLGQADGDKAGCGQGMQADSSAPDPNQTCRPHPALAALAASDSALEIRQLAQALQQLQQDLQQMEQERVMLLAGVSHDLRTPLTKLRLSCALLQAQLPGADEQDLLAGMVGQIANANQIIEQFISYARAAVSSGCQEVALSSVLQEVMQQHPHARLEIDPALLHLPLYCHPDLLHSALHNLLQNAARYAPAQAGDAHLLQVRREANRLCLQVMDRGPGIAPDERARALQAFQRLGQTDCKGAGLGLAIVQRCADLHGGQLELGTREGGGLVVSLFLPLTQAS